MDDFFLEIPLLFDEGWGQVAGALRAVGVDAHAVGDDGFELETGGDDEDNVSWCAERGGLLITHDRGKKEPEIRRHLREYRVHVLFLLKDLRQAPQKQTLRALLIGEHKIAAEIARCEKRRHLMAARLRQGGGLEKP